MRSPRPIAIGALVALAQVVANGGGPSASHAEGELAAGARPSVSFRKDVAPVLGDSCSTSSCHGGGSRPPVFGRGHDAATIRIALVGVASEDRPDRAYVTPGAPESSYLLQKIDGHLIDDECTDHDCGSPMPLDNPPLSPEARAMIRLWIAQGARDT